MSYGVACCPRCADKPPLISTMVFPGAEFYCLDCGGHYGFLEPIASHGPEIEARLVQYQEEWDENVGKKLVGPGRFWRFDDCDKCVPGGEYHGQHLTQEEITADDEACDWLAQRVKVVA